jgi:hypothetical protein
MLAHTRGFAAAGILVAAALSLSGGVAIAGTGATKDEAVAMVAYIKAEGPDKAYPEGQRSIGPVRRPRPLYRGLWNGRDGARPRR